MIDKKQLTRSDREYGRTERVHLTVLTDAEKDIYTSNRFPESFKGNEYLVVLFLQSVRVVPFP